MTRTIYILNGPNLNLLGAREPEIYGTQTLEDIREMCAARADALGFAIAFHQTNNEGELVSLVQEASEQAAGLILNAAAYTHSSIALHDALKSCTIPAIEVHLSNIFTREDFRHHSYVSPAVTGMICGLGGQGYLLALEALATWRKA
ncbi:MAG: type II 3-dehydroquinate dehydratase [Hyphomicrobiales bacterium]|nr:MAG: type II 3-dehydroquinate dehydratase [Hyphomicrobiales bacterium]